MKKKSLGPSAKLSLSKTAILALTHIEANNLKGGSAQGHTGTTTCTQPPDNTFANCDATASICQGLTCTSNPTRN